MTGSDWAVVPAVGGGTARTTVVIVVDAVVKLLPTRSPRIINIWRAKFIFKIILYFLDLGKFCE